MKKILTLLYNDFRRITKLKKATSEQPHSVKYTVAVGLKNPLFNWDKPRPKIDRVGPREVGEANGGGGLPWVAAQGVFLGQRPKSEMGLVVLHR